MKKIISFLISLSLVFTSVVVLAQSEYTTENSDSKIELLSELGIFKTSDFSSEGNYLTRAQAARLLVKMTGVDVSPSVDMPFTDVEKDSENYSYIAAAYTMKYISGVSATKFAPNEPVTKSQVAKIIMSILGYDVPCIAAGGYPAGYLKYANEVQLFKGLSFSGAEYITPNEMSNIILNALNAELMIQTSFGDETGYTSYENKNLLSENFDIYTETAIIEAGKYMSLYDKTGTGTDDVIAASVVYDASSYTGTVPVGFSGEIYYRQESSGSKRELLSIVVSEENNTVYNFTSKNIESASPSQIEYTDKNGKEKKIGVAANAVILYNGQLVSDTANIFDNFDEIDVIDNDKSGNADVVHIKKYTTMQVKSLSKDAFTVYDKISKQSYCFDNTSDFSTVFYYDGGITDFYEIEKDSILSVLIPKDKSSLYTQHVYVTDTYEDAAVDEVNSTESEVIVGGVTYPVSNNVLNIIKGGARYRLYFDVMGRIAVAKNIEDIKNYAYIVGIYQGSFGKMDAGIFTTDGKWLEVGVADNIKYNGLKIQSENIYSQSELFSGGDIIPQLIEYTLNSQGLINSITTATDVTAIRFTEEESDIIEKDEFRLSFSSSSSRFINSSQTLTFGQKAHLSGDAIIMMIPEDGVSKDKFIITTPDKLTHNIDYQGIKLYNCDEYACSSLAVMYDNTASYRGTNPLVVSRVTTVLNNNGEPTERVYGYARTTYELEYDVDTSVTLSGITGTDLSLKPGDIIIPVVNADNKIVNFERVHNVGTTTHGATASNIYTDYVTIYGSVINAGPDYVVLDYSADKASFRLYSTSVYVCEVARDGSYTVRLGSVNDLQIGDDVSIRSYYLRGTVAVVYKRQ